MSKPQSWTVIAGLFLIGLLGGLFAQQQFSGGQAVTQSGSWTVQPGNTANTTPWLATINQGGNSATVSAAGALKVDGSAVTQPASLASLPALVAGTAKIGTTYPYSSCGTTAFTKALQAMPTSSTAIASSTTCVLQLTLTNTTGGALTVTISDNQGTPVNFLNAVTMNAGETRTYLNVGNFTSGIKVLASGSGLNYALEGLQ